MSQVEQIVNKFLNELRDAGYPGMFSNQSAVDSPREAPVNYDTETGWAHGTSTGAPRSKGVDELRKELYDKGYKVIADQIPVYHCIAFWLKQPFPETAFLNIDKVKYALSDFGVFAPLLDDAVENNLLDNIIWQTKSVLGTVISTNRDYPKTEYRGQWDREGFVKVVWNDFNAAPDFSPSPIPNYQELVKNDAIKRPGAQAFAQHERRLDTFGFNSSPIPGTDREDHYVYNIWWYGRTDGDVTRFWRNWAVAVGANVSLE